MFLKERRQKVVLPPIHLMIEEYPNYACHCGCGKQVEGGFDSIVTPGISYDSNCEALVAYLHARQYVPYNRIAEMCRHIFNLGISEGTIQNMLERFSNQVSGLYTTIREKISFAKWVGSDETGAFVNTKKWWLWTWQNDDYNYFTVSPSRGSITIETEFLEGLKSTILVHDCLAGQFKADALPHQVCLPHLLRELKHLHSLYRNPWSEQCKQLLIQVIGLKIE